MAGAILSGSQQNFSILHYLPFSAPAVEPVQYKEDEQTVLIRAVTGTALCAIALAALGWICPPVALLGIEYKVLIVYGSAALLVFIEHFRAESAADKLAAQEFLDSQSPSTRATDRISISSRALQYVLDGRPATLRGSRSARGWRSRNCRPHSRT